MLDRFLMESLDRHHRENQATATTNNRPSEPFSLVEVGTYCGYSTVRLVHTILEWNLRRQKIKPPSDSTTMDFHVFTVDVNPQTIQIAKRLVALAGLESHVTFLLLKSN